MYIRNYKIIVLILSLLLIGIASKEILLLILECYFKKKDRNRTAHIPNEFLNKNKLGISK